MIHQKKLENVEYFNYMGSTITNDARCKREMKSRISIAQAAFNSKKTLFTSKLDLNLSKKLVKCYIWNIAVYGAETWTVRKVDHKCMESFEMWCWRRKEMTVRNEEVLRIAKKKWNIVHTYKKKKG
jgi:hypothetical protein